MFFDAQRILAVREMILADDEAAAAWRSPRSSRCSARISSSCSRSWRPAGHDPPARPAAARVLPHGEAEIAEVAHALGVDLAKVKQRLTALSESNPMLGHRGCRLGISYPEIYEMAGPRHLEATVQVKAETGENGDARDHDPLVGTKKESTS